MKIVELKCCNCNKIFEKSKKEYDRQLKNGRKNFYCCKSCSGKANIRNLGNHVGVGKSKYLIANNKRDEFTPFRNHMRRIKTRNVEKGKKYNVDVKYLKEVWDNQDGKCAITGINLVLENKISNPNFSASLDRIDSNIGYMQGNLQWISVTTNHAKNKFDNNVLLEYISILQNLS